MAKTSLSSTTRGGAGSSTNSTPNTGKTSPSYNESAKTSVDTLLQDKQYYGTFPDRPVAEQNQTYFAYFDGVGGTGPEYIDGTAYFIKYLIDTEGNIANPEPYTVTDSPQAVPLHNLKDNFEVGKRATVKLIETNPIYDTIPNAEILQGTYNIAHVGRIVPIAVTETGENKQDFITTMSFGPLSTLTDAFIPDLSHVVQYRPGSDSNVIISDDSNPTQYISYTNIITDGPSWDSSGFSIVAQSSSADTSTRIRFSITAYIGISPGDWGGDSDDYYENYVRYLVLKNDSIFLASDQFWISNDADYNAGSRYITYVTDWFDDYEENDTFKVQVIVSNYTDPGNGKYIYYRGGPSVDGTRWIVQQETPHGLYENTPTEVQLTPGVNAIYSPYFSASLNNTITISGSYYPESSFSYLILSPTASLLYESNLTQNLDPASSTFGFSNINIPFSDVQSGDFIRFEYNKDNIFNILDVGYYSDFVSGSNDYTGLVTFKISPPLGKTSVGSVFTLNHFCIYRVLNDGVYVVLDVKKDAPGGAYSGILQPEFVTKELVQKYDKIIQDLTDKEIIQ